MAGHINLLKKYFHHLSDRQISRFRELQPLYDEWNAKINVISRKDIKQLYERHVLHSMAIARIMQFHPGTDILDIGTGGGFPGIPLAIFFPQSNFTLIDSVRKKINVVSSIATALDLKNVTPLAIRAEHAPGTYDFVTCRAVARLSTLVEWTRGKVKKSSGRGIVNGMLCLKGGDIREELDEIKERYKVYEISDFFDEPFFKTKKLVHIRL